MNVSHKFFRKSISRHGQRNASTSCLKHNLKKNMPVVAQNRGWKTGDTSHQYEQIFKRTYNHIIEKGQSAVLDPIPEGLGYAYADAYRKGKQDATVDGVSNLKILLAHRIKQFRDIGVRVQIDECETHCRRMAHRWICDVFGAHRALNPRLGQAAKMLQQNGAKVQSDQRRSPKV